MSKITGEQLSEIALNYQTIAKAFLNYKLDNADKLTIVQFQDLSGRINLIVHNSIILAALSTITTKTDVSSSLDLLKQSQNDITEALKKIADVQKVIDLAATVINIGTSIISGDVNGIIKNIGDFMKFLQPAK